MRLDPGDHHLTTLAVTQASQNGRIIGAGKMLFFQNMLGGHGFPQVDDRRADAFRVLLGDQIRHRKPPRRPQQQAAIMDHQPGIGHDWNKAFLHIDGFQRRYNGDHSVLEGKYAMNLWQVGDVVVDDHEFQLEPNFTPGDYGVYFGFFSGETRFRVSRGENHENRVMGGTLHVR